MKIKYSIVPIAFFLISALFFLINIIFAQSPENIQYPVKELGNCQSQESCRAYCDKSENTSKCLYFAKANNLMTEEEINTAEKFVAAGFKGPGECKNKNACEAYCNDISHINECISFAEENNILPPKELEEAKKVQSAIARGVKPPPCSNKKACDTYCEAPEHMEECIVFGESAGFIQGRELDDAKKMLVAIKKGVKPPPCRGKEACDQYCGNPDNMETCMTFAMEAGFMSEQEKADSQKMLSAIKKGVKPPNCKGREECDVYCSEEEHFEECMNFAEAAGFMSAEDAKMARKTGGKGPGGCKGKGECEAFCNNSNNQETCFNFAKENKMIPEEDLKQMEAGKEQFKQSLQQMPQKVSECLEGKIGSDMLEKMKNGVMPPRDIGEKMRECFEKMGPPPAGRPGEGGNIPPAGQAGPGGCKGPEECKAYCESNPEDCKNFQPASPSPAETLQNRPPCNTPEECKEMQNRRINQQNPMPCQGENCQYGPPSYDQPYQQQPGNLIQPPLPGTPNLQQQPPPSGTEQIPAGQIEQQIQPAPIQPPPTGQQAPPPPPTSPSGFIKLINMFTASILEFFKMR